MDNITHGLTGALIGYCGFRQRAGRVALWTAVAAAEFPDLDIVMAAFGNETYLRWHRSFTHSAVLLPVWAAVVAGIIWAFAKSGDFKWLWLAAAAGLASHLALDWITNYGTELLWPVSDARFALSWVLIVDVYVWVLLLAGVALAVWSQQPAMARTWLVVVSAFVLFCGASRAWALRGQSPGTMAFAVPLNPLRWTLVRVEGDMVHWISDGRNHTYRQFRDEQLVPQAEATEAVRLFRWFTGIPLVEKLEESGRTVLRYRDLRFRSPMPWGKVSEGMFVVARVVFDSQGRLVTASLGGKPD